MPYVARDDLVQKNLADSFRSYNLIEKLQMISTVVSTLVLVFVPDLILETIRGQKKPNRGRLMTVIPNQIYQQKYGCNGEINGTILKSKRGDALLIHTSPSITPTFLQDVQDLGAPVKYIYVSNEVHETFASQCKEAFPEAKVLTPKPCKKEVEKCVPVDGVVEEYMEVLEQEFGVVKVFKADDNGHAEADRSWVLEIFGANDSPKKHCLFVGQCGYGHFAKFDLRGYLAGFQGLFTRGRYFRMFYWAFAKNHKQINPFWNHMVRSVDNLQAVVFQHGDPIMGENTKEQLLKFYVY